MNRRMRAIPARGVCAGRIPIAGVALSAVLLLAACGQKGPLYLPGGVDAGAESVETGVEPLSAEDPAIESGQEEQQSAE